MMKKKCIVVLCGQYFPDAGAPASCFLPYIKQLDKDNDVTIVCRKTSSTPVSQYQGTIPFIQLTTWYNTLRYYLQDRIRAGIHVRLNTFFLNAVRLYSSIRTMFCYPTQHNWIIHKYIKALHKLEAEKRQIDVVISVSFPFCSHIAALYYKKKHLKVKWLTYSTDPFTYNECQYERVAFKAHKRSWAKKIEKEIYNTAEANIVTEELYSMLVNSFNQPSSKTIAFPYLITSTLQGKTVMRESMSKRIKCVYAGSLYIDIRSPRVMVEIFKRIDSNIELVLYADGDLNIRELLKEINSDNIVVNGLVDRKTYERIITEEADILINIGNTTTLQSPSKLLELVSTGKPIINFFSNKDFGYQVIDKYPLGLNITNDVLEEGMVKQVQSFCETNNQRILEFDMIKNLYPDHIMENQMRVLNNLIS